MSKGWRRAIGCLELQVIYRKRATNYGALLRKITYKDKASYDSTPPCISFSSFVHGFKEYGLGSFVSSSLEGFRV